MDKTAVIAEIIRAVGDYYGVSYKDISQKQAQEYPLSAARSMAMLMLRERGGLSAAEVAREFRVTVRGVHYRYNQAKEHLKKKSRFYTDYEEITKILNTKI